MQRTLVLLKPDCVERRLGWEVLRRIDIKGLNVIAMKMLAITPDLAKQHYAEHVGKPFYPDLEAFITGGPSVAMLIEGEGAISAMRAMLGPTDCQEAPPGTIRGDLGTSKQKNLVHASDGEESAKREMALYFSDDEICD